MRRTILGLLAIAALVACGSGGSSGDRRTAVTFELQHGSADGAPTYRASTTDAALIAEARAELSKPLGERSKHVNGVIAAGAGDDNAPWNWHFVEDEWALAEISIEVCDAEPAFVAENRDEWIRDVGRYCPWSALVVAEIAP